MHYVEVLVADIKFHGSEALTYSSESSLNRGSIVVIPLRQSQVLGVVIGCSQNKPAFKVKTVIDVPDLPPLPESLISLIYWMKDYYPAPLGILTQLIMPKQLPKKAFSLPETNDSKTGLPPLSKDQQAALAKIKCPGLHLLHGETGTGKTRLYIELARRSLKSGRSSIILTPEIGLTSQLQDNFRHIFGEQVVVIHSQLTDAVRQRVWQAILKHKNPMVIIGARSALFSPLGNVGLIVLDESHESAYKQDQSPYYHATPVAAKLASLHGATLVLGSATPLISDYYVANAKHRPIVRMTEKAKGENVAESPMEIVDLKDRSSFTQSPFLSNQLIAKVKATLSKKEQSLIFLNRRGTARIVFCEKCGWQASCPHCDLPLVYHSDTHLVRCHSCDYKTNTPNSCPACSSPSVIFKSIGTKAVADELKKLFPTAKIMRFDTDNKKDERIEQNYEAIKKGEVDILVGTQTLAKGLDLPNLSLVGVVIADTGLYFPDFSAQERTYQLLAQVIGRVGRGHREGHAIVQTYSPDSPLIRSVLARNWLAFYDREISERKAFNFPPFCYVIKLSCRRSSQNSAQNAATGLMTKLEKEYAGITIEGPAPCFREKVQGKFAWQLIVKSTSRKRLVEIIKSLPSGWSYDIDPMNLL